MSEIRASKNQSSVVRQFVRPKPKLSHWPITWHKVNPVNQSKLEANTCSWREARENVCERVTFGFCFTPDWLTKWREFFKPIA